jgi:hypothetical protein
MLVIYLQLREKNIKTQSFKKDDYIKFQWRESTVLEPVVVEPIEATHFCLVDEQNYIFLPEQINAPCEEFDTIFNNTPETVGGIVWDISLLPKIMEVLKND